MKARYVLPLAIALSACATTPPPPVTQDRSAWEKFGYDGFGEKIERLAGAEARHCGIVNLIDPNDPINQGVSLESARACVAESVAAGNPFKYATLRIPIDSFLFEAVIQTPEKEFWIVHYDVMVGDPSENLHDVQRCKGLNLRKSKTLYQGVDCYKVPTASWLPDIPEQQK